MEAKSLDGLLPSGLTRGGKREGDREGIVGKIGRKNNGRGDGGGWGRGSVARKRPGADAFEILSLAVSPSPSLSLPLTLSLKQREREGERGREREREREREKHSLAQTQTHHFTLEIVNLADGEVGGGVGANDRGCHSAAVGEGDLDALRGAHDMCIR